MKESKGVRVTASTVESFADSAIETRIISQEKSREMRIFRTGGEKNIATFKYYLM